LLGRLARLLSSPWIPDDTASWLAAAAQQQRGARERLRSSNAAPESGCAAATRRPRAAAQ
ncbi:MAG TPA: hypothetical protein VM686_24260, partial [Polyangiaceae bacterium]|nr:hypothetical protein [Polyangiaceae bacterium]